jgi:hypothetical protein
MCRECFPQTVQVFLLEPFLINTVFMLRLEHAGHKQNMNYMSALDCPHEVKMAQNNDDCLPALQTPVAISILLPSKFHNN